VTDNFQNLFYFDEIIYKEVQTKYKIIILLIFFSAIISVCFSGIEIQETSIVDHSLKNLSDRKKFNLL